MSISRSATPDARASARAFSSVRAVVPKPGMVTARIPSRGRPSRSKVRSTTSRASVESRPPESPRVTRFDAGVLEPLGEARGLDGEDLAQRSSSSGRVRRARRDGDPPGARGGAAAAAGIGCERRCAGSPAGSTCTASANEVCRMRSTQQPLDVDVGHDQLAVAPEALALGEEHAVLGHQQLAAEHDVGGGLVHPVVRVDVGGQRAARTATFTSSRRYSALATSSLEAERFRSTVAPATAWSCSGGIGAQRSSQISTASVTAGSSSHREEEVGPEGRRLPGQADSRRAGLARRRRTSAPRSTPCSRGGTSWAPRPGSGPPGAPPPR